jgi:uncharacterized membrane protein
LNLLSAGFGLLSAFAFGLATFFGGMASRRAALVAVTALSQSAGLVFIVLLVGFIPGRATASDLAWGLLAGVFHLCGIFLFFRALVTGVMGVVVPVVSVIAVGVPLIVGLLLGESVSVFQMCGIAMAFAAIVLISVSSGPTTHGVKNSEIIQAVLAGLCFGGMLVVFGSAGSHSGIWPLLAARSLEFVAVIGIVLITRTSLRIPTMVLRTSICTGFAQESATAFFLVARHLGELSIVSVLTSLDTAVAVILAWIVLGERLRRRQIAGVVVATIAGALLVM